MGLTYLPEEIIRIIIQYLDIESVKTLYETCSLLRGIISMPGIVKKCNMSLSTVATARLFKTSFFKDISPFIQELNVSAVSDLSKTSFLAAVKKLKALKTLDVSYTPLNIESILDITEICPNIKTVCVNLDLNENITEQSLLNIQNFIGKLENLHLVGSVNELLYSTMGCYVLQKAKLNSLKFSVSRRKIGYSPVNVNFMNFSAPSFNQFCIFMLDWVNAGIGFPILRGLPVIEVLDMKNIEFILISFRDFETLEDVIATNLFIDFFHKYLHLRVRCVPDLSDVYSPGNMTLMFWNKNTTKFDTNFFDTLYKDIKHYFPYRPKMTEKTVSQKHDWFIVTPALSTGGVVDRDTGVKRRRIGAKKRVLDFDTLFKNKDRLELSVISNDDIKDVMTLSPNTNYLSKLTYLSFSGSIKYSSEFFNILFRCGVLLRTLSVQSYILSPCCKSICRSLPLSSSIRNLRLVENGIDFKAMFLALSQCRDIENVILSDDGVKSIQYVDPSLLLKNCNKLYNLHLNFTISEYSFKNQWRPLFSKAITKYNRHYMNLVLCPMIEQKIKLIENNFEPYMKVFQLNSITAV